MTIDPQTDESQMAMPTALARSHFAAFSGVGHESGLQEPQSGSVDVSDDSTTADDNADDDDDDDEIDSNGASDAEREQDRRERYEYAYTFTRSAPLASFAPGDDDNEQTEPRFDTAHGLLRIPIDDVAFLQGLQLRPIEQLPADAPPASAYLYQPDSDTFVRADRPVFLQRREFIRRYYVPRQARQRQRGRRTGPRLELQESLLVTDLRDPHGPQSAGPGIEIQLFVQQRPDSEGINLLPVGEPLRVRASSTGGGLVRTAFDIAPQAFADVRDARTWVAFVYNPAQFLFANAVPARQARRVLLQPEAELGDAVHVLQTSRRYLIPVVVAPWRAAARHATAAVTRASKRRERERPPLLDADAIDDPTLFGEKAPPAGGAQLDLRDRLFALAAKRRAERQIADEAHRFSGRTAETFEEELDKAVAQRRATKRVRSPTKPHQAVGGRSPPSKRQQVGGELEDEEEEEEEADRVAYATMRKAVGRLFDDWTGAAPLGSADRDALRAWVVSAVLEAETERWVGVSDGRGDYVDQFERVVAEGVPGLLDHDADPNAG
jgi:hypothetical protein